MSATHASTDDQANHETHPHPPMPAVTDEAADTPNWVPVSGLVLFVLLVLFVMARASMTPTVIEIDEIEVEADAPADGVVVPPAPQ